MFLRATVKGKDGQFAASLNPSLDRAYGMVIHLGTGQASYEVMEDIKFEVTDSGALMEVPLRRTGHCRECGGRHS